MGCGESKHAVATADTVSQSKRSNSKKANGQENPTVIERATDDVKANTNASLEEPKKGAKVVVNEGENVNKDSGGAIVKESEIPKADDVTESEVPKADDVKESDHQGKGETVVETVKEKENKETAVVPEDTKDESEKKDLKEGSTEETKKEEAGPDSPPKKAASEQQTDANEIVEDKGPTTETKSEEALTENKGNQDKEGEAAVQTTEAKAEKAPDAKEEHATESSEKDPKTT